MGLSSTELEKIADGDYSFDFLEITLTQMKDESPVQYSGSGSVFFAENGILQLKMYHIYEDQEQVNNDIKSFGKYQTPGKIISRENYFSMKSYDINGNEWSADYLRPQGSLSIPSNGRVITAIIEEIVSSEKIERTDKLNLLVLANGKFEFPWNSYEESNGYQSLKICKVIRNSFSWSARKSESDIVQIHATFEAEYVKENSSKLFLESLSIALGKYIHPIVWVETLNNKKITKVCSRQKHVESKSVSQPIPTRALHEFHHIATFVENYLTFLSEPNSPMFGYWYRILDSGNSDIENKALIITTTIEGVLKEYFNELGKPDSAFAEEAKQAKGIVEPLDIGCRVKNRILDSLGNANGFTAKNALHNLSKMNVISTNMIKAWSKLRNKCTHAEQLKNNNAEIQLTLDRIFCCIGIFHLLLLSKLGYTGTFINYNKDGWPEEPFPNNGLINHVTESS